MEQTGSGDYQLDAVRLERLVSSIFQKVGAPVENAEIMARSLVAADLRGMNSHGILRLPIYVRRLQSGGFRPDRKGRIVRESAGTVLIDGEDGLGAVVTSRAMDEAIQRARTTGIAAAGVFNSNHNGEGAFFALRAIAAGMIGICTTNGSPNTPPWGGKTKVTGPLPITIGVPAGEEWPLVLDMALGVSSRGKILYYADKGIPLPDGWLVDAEGQPSNDAEHIRQGGWILPIGGYKGWGLITIMEVLSGVLTGGALGRDIVELYGDTTKAQKIGHFVIAINVAAFMELSTFKSRMDAYIRMLKASGPASETQQGVIIPGQREFCKEKEQRQNGLMVSCKVVDEVLAIACELSIEPDL
jgi:LDH2 family malate/lactate/ureidoglycolate dehydrogenase